MPPTPAATLPRQPVNLTRLRVGAEARYHGARLERADLPAESASLEREADRLPSELRGLAVGDLDLDGTMELVVSAARSSPVNIWVLEHTGATRAG